MIPYFVIFFIVAFLALGDAFNIKEDQRKFLFILISFILSLFAGLRYGDQDWYNYRDIFDNVVFDSGGGSVDFGFNILCLIVSIFTHNVILLFLIVAFLGVLFNVISFKRYTSYYFIAILFYFSHIFLLKEMIQIRAGLAGALCLFSVRYLNRKNILFFWGIIIAAISIHLGSVIFVFVYLFYRLKISLKVWKILLFFCFLVGFLYPLGQVLKKLPSIDLLIRIQTYSNWDEYSQSLGILSNPSTLKLIIVSILLMRYYEHLKNKVCHFEILASAYFASTCWLMLWNDFAIFGARIATFLSVGEPLLLTSFLYLFKINSRSLVVFLMIVISLLMLLMNLFTKVLPYQFYLIR